MKKKNIIVIMTDEQRFDSLGCMGNPVVKTPNIDMLAEEGHLFTNAHCTSPLCVPSRVSMFTSQYVCRNGCVTNKEEHHINTCNRSSYFIEELKTNGYKIGLAGKNHTFTGEYLNKWFDYREEYLHWGKTHGSISDKDKSVYDYRNREKRPDFITPSGIMQEGLIDEPEPFRKEECMSHRIAEDAIRFVQENKDNPFFLYFSFPDPHWPNLVCEPYFSMYKIDEIPDLEGTDIDWSTHPFKHFVQSRVNGYADYSMDERKKILAVYYGMITYIDNSIGILMNKIKELSLEEDTVIIYCADHGNFAGRYGLVAKTGGFYDALVKIPLIFMLPGMDKNRKITAQVSNIDIFPTIFDYLGIDVPDYIQGQSFLDVLKGLKEEHRLEVFSEVGRPELPPPIIPMETFVEHNAKMCGERGSFWFVDYTGKGRSVMIKKDEWKYCHYVGDCAELYNLKSDPLELVNLASNPEYDNIKNSLKSRLLDWLLTAPFSNRI